jgi:hypothetical protein
MKWYKIIFDKLKFLIGKIVTKFKRGSKNQPYPQAVAEFNPDTNEITGIKYFIVLNGKGEVLNTPLFSTIEEAEAWIENYLIEQSKNNTPN